METYKVIVGDPFGGYVTIGENLTEEEADAIVDEESKVVDYFTTVQKVKE